jgi:membrane-bound inhibitor of C-type lysozyme
VAVVLNVGLGGCAASDDQREQLAPRLTVPEATDETTPDVPPRVKAFAYDCEDGAYVVAAYELATDDMWLFLPGRTVQLTHQPSGSGAKYSNGEITFWSQGHEALLDAGSSESVHCTENRRASILETVKLNGGDFWATGNEPGWTLEMYPQRFVLVSDYGQQRYEGTLSDPEQGGEARHTVFRSVGAEIDLEITMIGEQCADTMSDHRYETSVFVRVGETTYRGCGQALH